MKVVILCGGQGTRIRDVSEVIPKPMLPIGNRPILWHIMKIYADWGFKDFVLCLGYKGWIIKEFFLNYKAQMSDFTITLGEDKPTYPNGERPNDESDWKVTLVDTGDNTQTATRIWRVRDYLKDDDIFSVTYGDGLAKINIPELIETHKEAQEKRDCLLTVTGVHPSGRFGEIERDGSLATEFNEKPQASSGLINGGFMIFNKQVFDMGDSVFNGAETQSLESDVIPMLVRNGKVSVYYHKSFWQCVDTAREYNLLNQMWSEDRAFWSKHESIK